MPSRTARALALFASGLTPLAAGCGGSSPSHATVSSSEAGAPPPGGIGADGRIVAACQGFPLGGLHYSPGGSTLPNKCAAFDSTTNNPYAVRCIDAMPGYKTGYPGDEYCILPPPPDQGTQVGYHPQGAAYWQQMWAGDFSGYEHLSSDWALAPNAEVTQNYRNIATNPEAHDYYRTYFRMRTGSHHAIITANDNSMPIPEGWVALPSADAEASPALFDASQGSLLSVLGGQQRPDDGSPATLEKPPEDSGYYLKWPASPAVVFNLHYINAGSTPVLREGWVNLWWETDTHVLESWYMGMPSTEPKDFAVAPGGVLDYHASWTVPSGSSIRLVSAFGHRHFWTTNFSSWVERSGASSPEPVYQSFDWANMPSYRYDSLEHNQPSNPAMHVDGAPSGIMTLNPGDKLHFNCHVEYTDARAATDSSAPTPESNGTLHFKNETFKAEMCIQFGISTGNLGFPTEDTSPVPTFATQ
ncbi:MAG TPA: hypothetical protein VK762_14960 [Polyangiaceae bacterium]|nr:hypothetical protein [Polyangiaceae bacterium]